MDSKKLEMLITATDLGSFTKASEVVGYTQSGLTHMMDSLENEIGFAITERGHGGVRLNEKGRELLPYIKDFLKANSSLDNAILQMKNQAATTVRVAAYASIAIHWLPQVLYAFRRKCPEIDIDLRMVDNAIQPFELLEEGKTDIIFASRQKSYRINWTVLNEESVYAILPKDYPLNGRTEFPIEEFAGQDFLMPYGKFDIEVNQALARVGITVNAKSPKVDDETVIRMVEHGLGVTMMSELMFRGKVDNVLCVPVSPKTVREIGMGTKSGETPGYAVRMLEECVLETRESLIGEK